MRSTLSKLASALGGTDNLNAAIVAGAQKYDKNATHIAVERVAGARWNPTSSKPSVAAWCKGSSEESCSKNTIVFADDTFSSDYQFNTGVNGMVGPAYNRTKFTTDLDTAIQFTMAHEFGHVLSDANPIALKTYSAVWGGDDESMANELALQTISGGSQFAGWAFIYGFWDYTGRK